MSSTRGATTTMPDNPPGYFLPGGWSTADPKSEQIKKEAEFAAGRLNELSESQNYLYLTDVMNASSQVVAGMNYKFTIVGH